MSFVDINNNIIIRFVKHLEALVSEALAAGQLWVLLKSFKEEVCLKLGSLIHCYM